MLSANGQFIDLTVGVKWDDLRAPASGINPQGQASPPNVDSTDGGLLFGKGNIVAIWFQMPHAWKEGSEIYPHLHWVKTTTGAGLPNWQYKYKLGATGEVFTATTALIAGEEVLPSGDVIDKHAIWKFPAIDMTGYKLSTMIGIVLQRVNDANDTYAGNAKLLEFDIHYQIDAPGSRLEFIK